MIKNFVNYLMKQGITLVGKSKISKMDGRIDLPGLHKPVNVKRDKWGISHITAQDNHDLFFAQGFIHAQDRLWQMEVNRRTVNGTLSEIFGEIAVDTDRTTRTFGFKRVGLEDWNNASEELKDAINAYTTGINAFMHSSDTKYPIEFSLIKHTPSEWTPLDTTALSRFMMWQLSHGWYGELIRAQLIEAVGEEHAKELEIEYPTNNPTTLHKDIEFNKIVNGKLKKVKGPFLNKSLGSNSWVISGDKSETGMPILSNDMHLPVSTPSLWYQNHLKSNKINVTGVSIPGLPAVLVGHNDKIAWGMTLANTDAEDLFIEKIDPHDPSKYEFKGKWKDLTVISEEIPVKDGDPVFEKIYISHHGPIISDVVPGAMDAIAVNSMALKTSRAFDGFFKLNLANNWDDFTLGIREIEAPQLNVTYADVDGNIGYWCSGKVPIRKKGNGMVPVPGWTGEYEWKGEVPFEEMPHAFNPDQGYIVTANNKIITDEFPHWLGSIWMNGYRARRIEDIINSKDKISIEDCKMMQMDVTSIPGSEFIEHFRDIKMEDPDHRVDEALNIMKNWDGQLTADSVGGTLYSVTRYMAVKNLYEPGLGPELTNRIMTEGMHPLLLHTHEFFGHDTVVLLRMLKNPDSWWIKHAGGKEKLLKHSFNRAFEWIRERLGPNINNWSWGKIHSISFEHAFTMENKSFDLGPYPVGGDADTPCQMSFRAQDPFGVSSWAPSWRQIVDMGDLSNSEAMFAPGNSGQIGSKFYSNLINSWLEGEFYPMFWTLGQIQANLSSELTLKP